VTVGLPTEKQVTNRTFQAGKLAKRSVEEMNALKAMQQAAQTPEQREEEERTRAILEEYKEKRGKSLMEIHTEKEAEGQRGSKRAKMEERRGFDREAVEFFISSVCERVAACLD